MAIRLAALCFAAIQSSVISLTNALFDLAASPDCEAIMAGMREEVERELAAAAVSGGARHTKTEPAPVEKVRTPWTKALVARLHRVDSTLRESMRLNGFVARGPTKMVVVPEGVLLPDGTTRIPCGTKIGVSAYNVQHDEDVYKDAARFDAFRFVSPVRDADGASRTRESPQALVTTSPTFLAFSHGQWAW